jgi:lipoprotein-anchoring transpeptidase ErfK/SrfK
MKRLLIISLFCLLPFIGNTRNRIVVSKSDFTLTVLSEKEDTLYHCIIAYGKNPGNKTAIGDHRTPEGTFQVKMIYDATSWKHDFGDGKGTIHGAYGPYFIRLNVPGFESIGIHGTCFPESMGTMATEGCVRCTNEDITNIVKYISIGSDVMILPDSRKK